MSNPGKKGLGIRTAGATRPGRDFFLEAVHSELVSGTEGLASWILHLSALQEIETLFALEAWLRAIGAYFDPRRSGDWEAARKTFRESGLAPEIRTARGAIRRCELLAAGLAAAGQAQGIELEALVESRLRKSSVPEYTIGRILEQPSPIDSLNRLIDALNDLGVLAEAALRTDGPGLQLFLSLGRCFRRELRDCRFIDMLLSHRFRPQFDRVRSPVLSSLLRELADERLRRNLTLALLHFFRMLRYLQLIRTDLVSDRPPQDVLLLLVLLDECAAKASEFLHSRLSRSSASIPALAEAAEMVAHSLRSGTLLAVGRSLPALAREPDADVLHSRVEQAHLILRDCCESSLLALVRPLRADLDLRTVFPWTDRNSAVSAKLREDIWKLRQSLRAILEKGSEPSLEQALASLASFREGSLHLLMHKDWPIFEQFADSLVAAGDAQKTRVILKKAIGYLETLGQEVSKRGSLLDPGPPPPGQ